ncbi:MAG: tetratricopeptide repeat protein [Pseudomonadota bacterium]
MSIAAILLASVVVSAPSTADADAAFTANSMRSIQFGSEPVQFKSEDRGAGEAERQGPGTNSTGPGDDAGSSPAAKKSDDPLTRLMKESNLKTKRGRIELRDNLYALLATADNAQTAKKIERRIRTVWMAYGSDTVSLLLSRAEKAAAQKKSALALKLLDAAIDLAPDHAEAWNRRAFLQYKSGDVRSALGDLRRTLALDPSHFQALRGLARIFQESGRESAALKAYERLLDVYPLMKDVQKIHDRLKEKVGGRDL